MRVLVIEDHPADVALLQEAFNQSGIAVSMDAVPDGAEALAYIRQHAMPGEAPHLILLNLNVPGFDGFEVLEHLKTHPLWRLMPVIVFAASEEPADIQRAYDLQANAYAVKPSTPEELTMFVRHLCTYWCHTVTLPRALASV
ncbi:response regulator [Deinococcus maricopensis]|uniref:Response regulator receiver protein n=1 Tax=Deinococcus maricopensis (strain DSM 21211 / LMG 22137 / NRRL B-23946 / LB-34) TaxID=709986 RepID=E8U495_DEIML|nr:response regulator [Deinococcus maricopensis]ADV65932.1 response regulator receiver protein [Deinococcus maricopensis DSM 21211]